ncbi:hypothetical protein TrVGV298_006079 [Trichoderma virens]|nr:hypothetical protein TrVGV298_006079 [Trichoderma virens]
MQLLVKHIAQHVKAFTFVSVPVLADEDYEQRASMTPSSGDDQKASTTSDDDYEKWQLMREASNASDSSDLANFDDAPHLLKENKPLGYVETYPDTIETMWSEIGVNDYKNSHNSPAGPAAGKPDPILEHLAQYQSSNSLKQVGGQEDQLGFVDTVTDNEESYPKGFKKRSSEINSIPMHHPWLESSREFRMIISNLRDEDTKIPPVKIAIIDDGIDTTLDIFDGKIEASVSFSPNSFLKSNHSKLNYRYRYLPPSTLNHGSLVAWLVCLMCPKAKLYIYRLDETVSPTEVNMGEESAIKAIEWATEQRVDVICMAWTIGKRVTYSVQRRFDSAVFNADDKGIIMVSSAGDQEDQFVRTRPGKSDRCIRIAESTPIGGGIQLYPIVHRLTADFFFPGKAIPLGGPEGFLSCSGESAATAIAAGTASLMLYLDRLAEKWGRPREWNPPLQGIAAMKRVFERMSPGRYNPPNLEIFNKFNETSFTDNLQESCTKLNDILAPLKASQTSNLLRTPILDY